MYAVIFRAEIKALDPEYPAVAERLRTLALNEFGCIEFISSSESGCEIAISYWPTLEQIEAWENHPEHRQAQNLGRDRWYTSYRVQVVEVLREYRRK